MGRVIPETDLPVRAYPRREWGVDLARGVAIIGMFVAHTAPGAGPADLLHLSEYFPFPLFALLMGAGAELVARRMGPKRHFAESLTRGLLLLALGWLLAEAGAMVIVVLAPLGVFAVIAFVLTRAPSWAVALVGLVSGLLTPWSVDATRETRWQQLVEGDTATLWWLDLVVSPYYPQLLIVCVGSAGILLVRTVVAHPTPRSAVMAGLTAGLLFLGSFAVLVGHRLGRLHLAADEVSATTVWFSVAMAIAVAISCVLVARSRWSKVLVPVAWAGAMSLTLYSLHIVWLALWVRVFFPGEPDDRWFNVVLLSVGSLVIAALWRTLDMPGRWWRGPLEGVVGWICGLVGRTIDSGSQVSPSPTARRAAEVRG